MHYQCSDQPHPVGGHADTYSPALCSTLLMAKSTETPTIFRNAGQAKRYCLSPYPRLQQPGVCAFARVCVEGAWVCVYVYVDNGGGQITCTIELCYEDLCFFRLRHRPRTTCVSFLVRNS